MSTHINANLGEIAKTVIMPGDPLRAKYMALKFLENPRLVSETRGILAYTGIYNNHMFTIMASGMGMPSIGIYSYELFQDYDVDNIIRVGTMGAYDDTLNVYDMVLETEAYTDSSFAEVQNGNLNKINYPSEELNNLIFNASEKLHVKLKKGRIYSSDVFYSDVIDHEKVYKEKGCLGTEMESFALFHNAKLLNKKAATILTVSNHFFKAQDTTSLEREKGFEKMFLIALNIFND